MSEPRARLDRVRQDAELELNPEWSQRVDRLAELIFKRAVPRRVAEAVAADIIAGLKHGRSLQEICASADQHQEVYRVGVEEADELMFPPEARKMNGHAAAFNAGEARIVARSACGGEDKPDAGLIKWAESLLSDVDSWRKRPRKQ